MSRSRSASSSQFSLATWAAELSPGHSGLPATPNQAAALPASSDNPATDTQPLLQPPQTQQSTGRYGTTNSILPLDQGAATSGLNPELDTVSESGAYDRPIDLEAGGSTQRSRSVGVGHSERYAEKRFRTPRAETAEPLTRNGFAGWLLRSEGILLSALAQVLYACIAFFFKLINSREGAEKVGANQAVFVRMSITWMCCTVHLLWNRDPHPLLGPPTVRRLLVLRGFAGFFGVWGLYCALQYLDLTDATVITFLAPITTAIGGAFFLGERFVFQEGLAACISLVGVVLIARPPFLFGPQHPGVRASAMLSTSPASQSAWLSGSTLSPFGFGAMATEATDQQRVMATCTLLLGVLGSSTAYIAIRKIGRRASASHSVSYFSLWSAIVSGTAMLVKGERFVVPDASWAAAVLVLIGFFGFYGQYFAALGLQRAAAGKAAAAGYLQIVCATFFQLVFLHVPVAPLSIWGAVIIITSAIWVSLLK